MASLQTRLCLLFDILQVFMTSIKARNGLIEHSEYCDLRLKKQLQPICSRLVSILELESVDDATNNDVWLLYQAFYQMWTQLFINYQQRWTVQSIDETDNEWKLLYIDLKELIKSAQYLSLRMYDV